MADAIGAAATGAAQPRMLDPDMSYADSLPMNELYMPFEGLGNNCEFGIVQRQTGYDPPGLFRNVGFLNVDAIIGTIARNLEGMFDDGLYSFTQAEGWPDWRLDCMRYGFLFHTAIPATLARETDEWRKKSKDAIATFRFLKRLFQDELKSGEKTFVFRFIAPLAPEVIQRLLQAIRKQGPGWLLYVQQDPAAPQGEVALAENGLLVGKIDRLSNENPPIINAAAWERIARRVIALRAQVEAG